ncbi:hypothetical protein K8O93_07215 [Gordonia bronchialis]|uniref:hypothetical protein n=1 Tax=Gordonia bronchialis TaxID=2054 RepID=UPI001CBAEF6B|nr:hypothetical protein [Gordonia bronchialis]UAK39451.1 hypothetical protein K8O93_07215 [Gordonia bronchialis]
MSAPETSQALPVFSVEVTETTTTRYRVRAADADRAQDVATGHNIEEGSEGGEVVAYEREAEAFPEAPTEARSALVVITDPDDPPTVTVGEIADQIPARAAQLACAQMMTTLGGQAQWTSDTIEWVAAHLVSIAPASVPTFTDSGSATDGAVEFWQTVDLADTDSAAIDADGQGGAWLALNEALADHRRLTGQISAASEACDTGLLTALEMDEVDYLKRVRDAAEGVRRG